MSFFNVRNLSLLLGGGVLTLAVASHRMDSDAYNSSKLRIWIDMLGALSAVVFGLSLLDQQMSNEQDFAMAEVDHTYQATHELWIDPNQFFVDQAKTAPEFVGSLYTINPAIQSACTGTRRGVDACAKAMQEQNMYFYCAQIIANSVIINAFDATSQFKYAIQFLMWCKSPFLQRYNGLLGFMIEPWTKFYIDLIISYTQKYPLTTAEEFQSAATALMRDPSYAKMWQMSSQAIELNIGTPSG